MKPQGVQPLVRNEVTQNSPDFNRPGCLPRRAHIQGLPLYRSAPLSKAKGLSFERCPRFSSVLNQHVELSLFFFWDMKRPPTNGGRSKHRNRFSPNLRSYFLCIAAQGGNWIPPLRRHYNDLFPRQRLQPHCRLSLWSSNRKPSTSTWFRCLGTDP